MYMYMYMCIYSEGILEKIDKKTFTTVSKFWPLRG